MSRKFLTHLDLAKNELQNGVVQNLAAAPSSPVKGQLYMNSSDNTLYWYDGTTWVAAKAGGSSFPGYGSIVAEATFGGSSTDGVATTVARSDHKHANPLHDNAAHSTIPISALAAAAADVSMGGFKLTNLAAPVAGTDATNKTYVDGLVNGLAWKQPVSAASISANLTLSGVYNIDGVVLAANDPVLVKNQTNPQENGIYTIAAGAWTRRTDMDLGSEFPSATVMVRQGTVNGDTQWTCINEGAVLLGTTNIIWAQIAGPGTVTAGAGLTASGNAVNVIAGDTTLTVAADDVRVNTAVIATVASLAGYVPTTRTISTTAPVTGGGDLSANRTIAVTAATLTAQGVIEIADTAEALAGSDNTRALSPQGLANWWTGKRYAANVGGAVSQTFPHNFGARDVVVNVYRSTAPYDTVECDIERTDTNNVTLRFTTAPTTNEYRVVIQV